MLVLMVKPARQYAGICIAMRPLFGLLTLAAAELQKSGLIGASRTDRVAVEAVLFAPFVAYAKRPPTLRIRDASEQTGVAKATLRDRCRKGRYKGAHKRGKCWWIPQPITLRTRSASEDYNFGENRVSTVSRNRRQPRNDGGN